jgi:hypothetical protein
LRLSGFDRKVRGGNTRHVELITVPDYPNVSAVRITK